MTVEMLETRVQELGMELCDIKAELERMEAPSRPKSRDHLFGIIKNQPDLTIEDFEVVKIRMNWDKFKGTA